MSGAASQRVDFLSAVRLALGDIKLAHTVFALPFAVMAVFLAAPEQRGWQVAGLLGLVVACMFFARTFAMLVNRVADARFDADNARTARRAVASGALPRGKATTITAASAVCFAACCAGFWAFFGNPWPLVLSAPVLVWIGFYSFTKRFTWLCHVFLGGALAASPVCAAIAVRPESLSETPALWWLAGMITCWVAGFDVIYALQDRGFDEQRGLYSAPSRLGVGRAIWSSRVLHCVSFAALVMVWQSEPRFGVLFGAAALATGGLLVLEHAILAKRGEAGIQAAFFTVNGIVSVVLGAAGTLDLLVSGG